MNNTKRLTTKQTKELEKLMEDLPPDFERQIKRSSMVSRYRRLKEFQKAILINEWLGLYVGSREKKADQVIDQINIQYPEFQNEIKQWRKRYPSDEMRFDYNDKAEFFKWLRKNTIIGKPWGAFAWMTFRSKEFLGYEHWKCHLKYTASKIFIPFPEWMNKLTHPTTKATVDIEGNREELIKRWKELQSASQLYFERDENLFNSSEEKDSPPELSNKTKREIELYDFESRLKIVVTGKIPHHSSNTVEVEDVEVPVGDKSFILFLRLIVQLINNGGDGYIHKIDLIEEGFLNDGKTDQEILRLRNWFRPSLKGLHATKFIQVQSEQVRLSTPPTLIWVKKNKLIEKHPDSRVKELAKQLPDSSRIK